MRRSLVTGSVALFLAAGSTMWIGGRPPLYARPAPLGAMGRFGGQPEEPLPAGPVVHVATPPMTPEATRVWLKLQQKLDMNFANDTPLDDVVRYIQQATIDKQDFPEGIPVYVDPQGLQDADKTMASTINISLKGIPLATTLGLLLKQLGLEYHLHKDGFLFLTAIGSEDSPADPERLILDHLSALRTEVRALREEVRQHRFSSDASSGSVESKPKGGMGGMGGMM